jgi:hypothetical protein
MKTLKSISGREFRISPNKAKRTFTIRVDGSKYRTLQMNRDEFVEAYYWTGEDWHYFLRNTNDYYKVK